jgi:hypothetical protein
MILLNIVIFSMLTATAHQLPESGVMFSHQAHFSQRSIECTQCHSSIAQSVTSQDKNIPGHDVCSDCHSLEKTPDDCKLCHKNPGEPTGVRLPPQELIFSHKDHLSKMEATSKVCLSCHDGVDNAKKQLTADNYPAMSRCFECHDGVKAPAECKTCHTNSTEMMALIHPPDYEHSHRFDADAKQGNCQPCHQRETFCSDCHAGNNQVKRVHDLNYKYNHGLDVKGKEFECQNCHDIQTFCNDCHNQEGDMPLTHLYLDWNPRRNPSVHADAAKKDIESCAACHQDNQLTCAQPGSCHYDGDGIRGTNPTIHAPSITNLEHGPWHDDRSFECYQCHVYTGRSGFGFCGYCHGEKGN